MSLIVGQKRWSLFGGGSCPAKRSSQTYLKEKTKGQDKWNTCIPLGMIFNSLAPGRFQFNFRKVIFKLTLVNGGWGISYEIALRWMPQNLTDDKSTLVQVMAWCHQAISHYLSQCWPRSVSPYGITGPQRVKNVSHFVHTKGARRGVSKRLTSS